jgi:glyoxylase I family protein
MNHTGLVIRDLDQAVEFYRDVVGLTVAATWEREGAAISQVVGYENTHLKIAFLTAADGHNLELIQYVRPSRSERVRGERNSIGATHLCFNVDDIEQTFRQIVSGGARQLNPPAEVAPGRKACYLQDPDGNWIELLETNG